MGFFSTWKDIVFSPKVFFKKLSKKTKIKEPSKFFLKLQALTMGISFLIIFIYAMVSLSSMGAFGLMGLMLGLSSTMMIAAMALGMLILFPLILLLSWGFIFVVAGIVHIFVLIFGGKKGYSETFKVMCYSMAPGLFSFIPLVNIAVSIYMVVLEIMGIRERQNLSTGKSVLVILLPCLIFVVPAIILSLVY